MLSTSYGYTGREKDSESGLMYYRARYYDPNVGRFLQRDPEPTAGAAAPAIAAGGGIGGAIAAGAVGTGIGAGIGAAGGAVAGGFVGGGVSVAQGGAWGAGFAVGAGAGAIVGAIVGAVVGFGVGFGVGSSVAAPGTDTISVSQAQAVGGQSTAVLSKVCISKLAAYAGIAIVGSFTLATPEPFATKALGVALIAGGVIGFSATAVSCFGEGPR